MRREQKKGVPDALAINAMIENFKLGHCFRYFNVLLFLKSLSSVLNSKLV